MKLAFVAQPYDGVLPPDQNSIGLILYNTALQLSRQATVTLCTSPQSGRYHESYEGFVVSEIDARYDNQLAGFVERHPRWARYLRLTHLAEKHLHYVRLTAKRLESIDPDIVHVLNYWPWCGHLRGARQRKVVLEMQSEWLSQMDRRSVSRQLENVNAVIAVSDHIANLFRAAFPDYHGIVGTSYNGVNTDIFKPRDSHKRPGSESETQRILFVGRASPEKGIHTLIEAFAQVTKELVGARLDIVGPRTVLPATYLVTLSSDPDVRRLIEFYDGTITTDYQRYLDWLIDEFDMRDRIRFHGAMPHDDLIRMYQDADVLVNPSLSESFGISVIEAMACELPVIATKVGGMQETVKAGATGLLVPPDEPEEIAIALKRIFSDSDRANRMGESGRRRVLEKFSWRARATRLIDVYAELLTDN